MSETKKRLLLSKWRGEMEKLRDEVVSLQEKVDAFNWEQDELRDALESVRWWMHEPLVLQMPMRDPRVILRKIEDVLG